MILASAEVRIGNTSRCAGGSNAEYSIEKASNDRKMVVIDLCNKADIDWRVVSVCVFECIANDIAVDSLRIVSDNTAVIEEALRDILDRFLLVTTERAIITLDFDSLYNILEGL